MKTNDLYEDIYTHLDENYRELYDFFYKKTENYLGKREDYIMDTPHGFWEGSATTPLPANHSGRHSSCVHVMIQNAKKFIDITNLGLPSGTFMRAISRGLNSNKNRSEENPITIRILAGRTTKDVLDTKKFIQELMKPIRNRKSIKVYVGAQRYDVGLIGVSWNHSKYIAVDGQQVLFGGHNFNSEPYAGVNPIFDMSVKLDGPIAGRAHQFSNEIWTYVNKYVHVGGATTYSHSIVNNEIARRVAPGWECGMAIPSKNPPNIRSLVVSQPGIGILGYSVDLDRPNPSASAMNYAFEHAKNLISLSQQDLGGQMSTVFVYEGTIRTSISKLPFVTIQEPEWVRQFQSFDVNQFDAMSKNLAKNSKLQIQIVRTNYGAKSEQGEGYSNHGSVASIYRAFGWFLIKRRNLSKQKAIEIIRNQVHIKTVGFRGHTHWQAPENSQKFPIGNHGKFWAVDREVCYIGSHNLYPATTPLTYNQDLTGHLIEWGAILSNKKEDLVGLICSNYFDNMFRFGIKVAFKDSFLNGL